MTTANDASLNLSETLGKIHTDQAQIETEVKELKNTNTFINETLSKIMDVDPLRAHVESVKIETEMTIARQGLKQMMKATLDLLDLLR
ncbi:MAG: flagellin [Janthinobacterium lividum]